MPEGDTVWRQTRALHRALAHRIAHRTDFRVPAHSSIDLSGQPIHGALARGKNILLRIGDSTVHSHLKMDGIWHIYGTGADGYPESWKRPATAARAIIQANARLGPDGTPVTGSESVTAVGFNLGILEVFPTRQEESRLSHLGPDLLGPDWSPSQALERLAARPERAIGPALLDQKNLAGIGTIYRAETLFLAGIDPSSPVGAIPDLAGLISIAHRLLEVNKGRPHRVTRTSAEPLWCYGRAGRPCYRCGATIVQEDLSDSGVGANRYTPGHLFARPEDTDRLSYRCPGCQVLLT